jgi:cytochrome c oxidase assembly protein Cox11
MSDDLQRRNRKTTMLVLGVVATMAVVPWVYAPLYRKVCGALGIPVASNQPLKVLGKIAREGIGKDRGSGQSSLVNFMGVSGELPIEIAPLTRRAWVKTGEVFAVTYRLTNLTDRDLDYKAMHMVIPQPNTSFELIKCFCDDHRVIKAHVTEDLPLTFRLIKPVEGDAGLTVNYTIFNYDPEHNKAHSDVGVNWTTPSSRSRTSAPAT